MDSLSIIEHNPFSTSVVSLDESTLYSVTSRRHPNGYWVDVVYRLERWDKTHPKSDIQEIHTELATVFYINAGTTRVRFGENLEVGEQGIEGEVQVGLDAFLRRRKVYSNSRVFMGPNGVTYKWRIDGKRLELINTTTHTVIARSNPRSSRYSFPISFPKTTKRTRDANATTSTIRAQVKSCLTHPTLFIHPDLLALDSDSDMMQLLDAVVLTFIIMQRLLRERMQYRYL